MSSYRFCRTDDIGLLVDALNSCWGPYFPGEPEMTPAAFKRSIRDLQVWCSSCVVAFSGRDPIAVLIGAKRPAGTLIHRIAVHPDHLREGHARHLLTSLSSKLAILGPPRLVAEVPETFDAACALFRANGYVQETVLTDYVLGPDTCSAGVGGEQTFERETSRTGSFVIPITVDDLAANGLLEEDGVQTCWERSGETLRARKGELAGLAVATDEGIEAYLLYTHDGEVLAIGAPGEDSEPRLNSLLATLRARGMSALRIPKVHPDEVSAELLGGLGFQAVGNHLRLAGTAHSQ